MKEMAAPSIALSIDWFSCTMSSEALASVVSFLTLYFGAGADLDKGFYGYKRSVRWENSAQVSYSQGLDGEAERPELHVQLPGGAIGGMDLAEAGELLAGLEGLSADGLPAFRCCRLDIAVDDFKKRMMPQQVWSTCVRPGLFGPMKCRFLHENGTNGGVTVALGKRGKAGGGLQVNVYDKCAESNGRIDSVRYECSFSHERAERTYELLRSGGSISFPANAGKLVAGAVAFYSDFGRKRQALWWEEIVGELGGPLKSGVFPGDAVLRRDEELAGEVGDVSDMGGDG